MELALDHVHDSAGTPVPHSYLQLTTEVPRREATQAPRLSNPREDQSEDVCAARPLLAGPTALETGRRTATPEPAGAAIKGAAPFSALKHRKIDRSLRVRKLSLVRRQAHRDRYRQRCCSDLEGWVSRCATRIARRKRHPPRQVSTSPYRGCGEYYEGQGQHGFPVHETSSCMALIESARRMSTNVRP